MISNMNMIVTVLVWTAQSLDSSAIESENMNLSDTNYENFVHLENRKSNSCPDPSVITALLRLAAIMDSEEDSLISNVSQLESENACDFLINRPLQKSARYDSMHDSAPTEEDALYFQINAQSSNKSIVTVQKPAPKATLDLQRQMIYDMVIREFSESVPYDTDTYPSQWVLFMMSFGRWMTSRPLRSGIWKNQIQFTISGFETAKGWLLRVHFYWKQFKRCRTSSARSGSRWNWRQVGWLRFQPFESENTNDGNVHSDKVLIQWRLINVSRVTFDWSIQVRGTFPRGVVKTFPEASDWFHFFISKSVATKFQVHVSHWNDFY